MNNCLDNINNDNIIKDFQRVVRNKIKLNSIRVTKKLHNLKQIKPLQITQGMWFICPCCENTLPRAQLEKNLYICIYCNYYFPLPSNKRLEQIIDPNTWTAINNSLISTDPLGFYDIKAYNSRLEENKLKTKLQDAVETGIGLINGIKVACAVMDFRFMGGSMGSAVGEKITRLIEQATLYKLPVIIFCASGGARMQEGILSLMQMAKISSVLGQHKNASLLYISVLTSPTTGGVTASFGMLGDIIIAEPRAVVAFAGRRVIEQTIKQKLPPDFQIAELLWKKGFLDLIIPRTELKNKLYQLIKLHCQVVL
jgi:acetyl-CoA carboxylase carboxyl transferase subunit beta